MDRVWRHARESPTGRLLTFSAFEYSLLVVVSLLVLGPVLLLVYASFSPQGLPTDITLTGLGMQNYKEVYGSGRIAGIASNTFVYVIGSVVLAISIAGAFAYAIERTDLPYKSLWYALLVASFAMPGMIQSIAWVLLLNPSGGYLNPFLAYAWEPLGQLGVNNLWGMVFVQGFHAAPMALIMLAPLMRNLDPSVEAAAAACGAKPWRRTVTITLPLLLPGGAAVAIYLSITALEVFEIPGILGMPGDVYVFSTYLYSLVHSVGRPTYNLASALSMGILVIAGLAMYFYYRVLRKSARYATLTGKGFRRDVRPLGRWKVPVIAALLGYILLAVVLPFMVLVYASLLPYLQPPSIAALRSLTFASYTFSGIGVNIWVVIKNTVILVVAAASLAVVLSTCISYVVVRGNFRRRGLLDTVAFIPHAVPGVVAGLAFLLIFIELGVLFGSVWAIVIAFVSGFVAYGTRSLNAAFLQVHPELEAAGAVSGIRRLRRVYGIVLPQIASALAGLWVLFALLSSRIAGLPIILSSGNSEDAVLSVVLWTLWNSGKVAHAAALGTLLMVVVFILTFLSRLFRPGGVRSSQSSV
jgi:iron(III) transport system permease protein